MKKLVIGILAHVDAGKTTLSEALLYAAGTIQTLGRVDHRNTYLDTHQLERARGITIFSKQALFSTGELEVTLLDTPGHVDFSAEMERTLQVLDYAILVISATDGVQAHTETLWRLLKRRQIPTFVFITKMDLPGINQAALLLDLQKHLDEGCIDFSAPTSQRMEALALRDEAMLERYLDSGTLSPQEISGLIRLGKVFPCSFGSALRMEGIGEFLQLLSQYTEAPVYPSAFGARVYKIGRDAQGGRLTYLKVTGGTLPVRTALSYLPPGEPSPLEEKVTQIRLYSGAKYHTTEEICSGQVCAVLGLSKTWPGQGLGTESQAPAPVLEPVLTYRVVLPPDCDPRQMLPKLRLLEEEDPLLHIVWEEHLREIHIRLMGQVQLEILKSLVADRFDTQIQVDSGRLLYKETIAAPVEGVGHFEPLRHYAEVHLLLEPLEPGSGLILDSLCSLDLLDRNWQRLILTHLEEKLHLGVLTGSPITDMKITLMSGRAHKKHTEGGDFRQATYRAVRQGLMGAQSVLLEPWYEFRLEVPLECLGRAISDLQTMSATFSAPENNGESALLTGTAPVSAMQAYPMEVAAYTRGRGHFSCSLHGYAPCHNAAQVIEAIGYDPDRDVDNPADSVFCAHGAGFQVKWDQVPDYMHLESCLTPEPDAQPTLTPRLYTRNLDLDDKELEAIFVREFGPIRRREYQFLSPAASQAPAHPIAPPKTRYLIVDGYNIIFAWEELSALAADNLDAARQQLMDLLSNYRSFQQCEVALVFDAYRVKGGAGSKFDYHQVHVVYTKEGETGDMYIERLTNEIGQNYAVRVATSDSLIQLSALRSGVLRISAMELKHEMDFVQEQIRSVLGKLNQRGSLSNPE